MWPVKAGGLPLTPSAVHSQKPPVERGDWKMPSPPCALRWSHSGNSCRVIQPRSPGKRYPLMQYCSHGDPSEASPWNWPPRLARRAALCSSVYTSMESGGQMWNICLASYQLGTSEHSASLSLSFLICRTGVQVSSSLRHCRV